MSATTISTDDNNDITFQDAFDLIIACIDENRTYEEIFEAAEDALWNFPESAEIILKEIDDLLPNHDGSGKLFDAVIIKRPELLKTFLDILCPADFSNITLIDNLLNRTLVREHVDIIDETVKYAARIHAKSPAALLKGLMINALRDAFYEKKTTLFDYLVKQEAILTGRWNLNVYLKDGTSSERLHMEAWGGSIFMWSVELSGNVNARYPDMITHTLRSLLNNGAKQEDPISITINGTTRKFDSCMEFVCWQTDVNNPSFICINALIKEGVEWDGFDVGEGAAAVHIRQQPKVKAHYRRVELEKVMEQAGTSKKPAPGSRM